VKKKVQLILGSGGARGIAHIPIIEGLLKDNIEISRVIGCSMGAVIGGIYAAGHLDEYKKWLLGLDRNEVFDLMDFTLTKEGFIKGEKIFNKHREMTGELCIEDFNIPFTAVAVDIVTGKEVYFTTGDLYNALRATVAIPGFIIPHKTGKHVLIDGGVTNPLPLNLASKEKNSIVIGVDLSGPSNKRLEIKKTNKGDKKPLPHWFEQIIPSYLQYEDDSDEQDRETLSLLKLMETTFTLSQNKVNELTIAYYPPDVLIRMPRSMAQTLDFFRAKEIYALGKQAYERNRNAILEKL
jgi:NTE family protein